MRILLLMILTTFTSLQALPIRTAYINYSTFVESPNDRPDIVVSFVIVNTGLNTQTITTNINLAVIPNGFLSSTNTTFNANTPQGSIVGSSGAAVGSINSNTNTLTAGDVMTVSFTASLSSTSNLSPFTKMNSSNLIRNNLITDSSVYGAGIYVAKILVTGTITANNINANNSSSVSISGSVAKPSTYFATFRNTINSFIVNEGKPL